MYPLKKGQFARQAHVGLPPGTYEEEHGRKGFYGKSAHLYHTHPPTGWIRFEGKLRPHCFDLNKVEPSDLRDPEGMPTAVLVVMHGSTSTPQRQIQLSRMARLTEKGALVAFPQGSVPSRRGWEWDLDSDVLYSQFFPTAVGHPLANVPRQTFNLFVTHRLPLRLSGGLGGNYVGARSASSTVPYVPTGFVPNPNGAGFANLLTTLVHN